MKKTIIVCAVFASLSNYVFAEEYFEVGPWSGERNLNYAIDSSEGDSKYGNPTSRLTFDGARVKGFYLEYGNITQENYKKLRFSLGKSSLNGSFDDWDWYSKSYAEEKGIDTLFSYTTSDLQVNQDATISYSSGYFLEESKFGFDKFGIGWKVSGHYTEYEGRGLTQFVSSYSSVDYDASTPIIRVRSYDVSHSTNFTGIKKLGENLFFTLDADVSLFDFSYISDSHLLREDLKDPGIEMYSVRLGIAGEAALLYKFSNDMALKLFADGYAYRLYTQGIARFHYQSGVSGNVKMVESDSNGFSFGLSISKRW